MSCTCSCGRPILVAFTRDRRARRDRCAVRRPRKLIMLGPAAVCCAAALSRRVGPIGAPPRGSSVMTASVGALALTLTETKVPFQARTLSRGGTVSARCTTQRKDAQVVDESPAGADRGPSGAACALTDLSTVGPLAARGCSVVFASHKDGFGHLTFTAPPRSSPPARPWVPGCSGTQRAATTGRGSSRLRSPVRRRVASSRPCRDRAAAR